MSQRSAIFEVLRDRILRREIKADEQLPGEYALCAEFQCARGTIRAALARLEREGFARVTLDKRRIAVIREPFQIVRFEHGSDPTPSFGKRIHQFGKKHGWSARDEAISLPQKTQIRQIPKDLRLSEGDICEQLRLKMDAQVFWFGRVRLAGTLPLVLQWTVVPASCVDAVTSDDMVPGGLFKVFCRNNLRRTRAEASNRPVAATKLESVQLQIEKGAPLLEESRVSICQREGQDREIFYEFTVTLFTDRVCVRNSWSESRTREK